MIAARGLLGAMLAIAPAVAGAAERVITLPLGTTVPLVTVTPLTSKTNVKGDVVPLRTSADVTIDGEVAIPRGTDAVGQVAESRGTGGMGTTGRLAIRPLYLRVGDRVVRLTGVARKSGGTGADTVLGMALLTPLLSGRSATIPVGTRVEAMVEKTVAVLSRGKATGYGATSDPAPR